MNSPLDKRTTMIRHLKSLLVFAGAQYIEVGNNLLTEGLDYLNAQNRLEKETQISKYLDFENMKARNFIEAVIEMLNENEEEMISQFQRDEQMNDPVDQQRLEVSSNRSNYDTYC